MKTNECQFAAMGEPSKKRFIPRSFRPHWSLALMLGALMIFGQASTAHAERLVDFAILLDGKLALDGFRMDSGQSLPDEVWNYLKTLEFTLPRNRQYGSKGGYAEGFAVIADANDPLSATLNGNLEIACRYGGTVEVKSLKLVRQTADSEKWRLAPEEIERTFKLRKPHAVDPNPTGKEKLATPAPLESQSLGQRFQEDLKKTRVEGNSSNRTGAKVENTPLRKYYASVRRALASSWNLLVQERRSMIAPGSAKFTFTIMPNGRAAKVAMGSNSSNAAFATLCEEAIQKAPIPKIPDDLGSYLPDGSIDFDMTFTFYDKP